MTIDITDSQAFSLPKLKLIFKTDKLFILRVLSRQAEEFREKQGNVQQLIEAFLFACFWSHRLRNRKKETTYQFYYNFSLLKKKNNFIMFAKIQI